jgi:hypothetical protein
MAKLDGTNGLLQQYDYQVLTTAFTYTFASGTQTLVINPAGTLATGTITMPAAPADGMVITIESTQAITALTVQGNTGQSLVGAPARIYPNQPESFIYRVTNTTWYPYSTARSAVLQVVQATSTAQTSTTSTSFVTTNLAATITPSSSTSKILAIVNMADCLIDTAAKNGCATLYRGSTNLSPAGTSVTNSMGVLRAESGGVQSNISFSYLDSPATTSSTTYTVYFAILAASASFTINNIGTASSIILMEIAA